MSRIPCRPHFLLAAVVSFVIPQARAVTIPTVTVGNAGNPVDTRYSFMSGAVAYSFRMGKYEVTNAQYAEFLNAVATIGDPYELYDFAMSGYPYGGIGQFRSNNRFTYVTKQGWENQPVNYVSWFDAIRFANWLHNGQGGPETTEDGAYTLLGGTPVPLNTNSITRNPGARWWLPTEDEWYKAAYHKSDGSSGNYWTYPTASDEPPFSGEPPGGSNSANIWPRLYLTDVGAYDGSASSYGTFDQGGNASEWQETISGNGHPYSAGGSWRDGSSRLHAAARTTRPRTSELDDVGFRVAAVLPEPNAIVLLGFGAFLFTSRRKRR